MLSGARRSFAGLRAYARLGAVALLAAALTAPPSALAGPSEIPEQPGDGGGCAAVDYRGAGYAVCRFDGRASDIRLFLYDEAGAPYGDFGRVNDALAASGERLVFAMNVGMYHQSRAPVGLYIERGEERAPLNANAGPGNFHLLPNGVFYMAQGAAGVMETGAFAASGVAPDYATQSGPMLVIDGAIHPRLLPDSDSLKRRNGVGVTASGEAIFVMADAPVRLYDLAAFFRDGLGAANALYLDGTISRLYAPALGRDDPGLSMGPIVGVATHD